MYESNGFTFGSWNAGTSAGDYAQLIRERKEATDKSPNFSGLSPSNPDDTAMVDSIANVRDKLLAETAKDLAHAADVYALQEVIGDDRADIQAFKSLGFEIFRAPRSGNPKWASETDTAIAINPAKFKDIENRSFNLPTRDFAVVVAVEKATGRKIAFISGHFSGFDLEAEEQQKEEVAVAGDREIKDMIKELKSICADCDSVMIGSDTNATPEIYQKRFQLFANAGFQMHRTGSPTSNLSRSFFGNKAVKLQERELDYIFVMDNRSNKSRGFLNTLRSLFKKREVYTTRLLKDNTQLSLDPISSPSDHLPVFVKVEKVQKETFISRSPETFNNLMGRVRTFFRSK